jgi:hypothetical protein
MELVGFSISQDWIELHQGSMSFDLHNDFDFQGMSYDSSARTLELRWRRGDGDWIVPTNPDALLLSFSGVYLLKIHERDPAMPFTEDSCLSIIGFIWNDWLSNMHGLASNRPSEGCGHLSISFMSGFSIKVGADSASLSVIGGV